MPVSNRTNCGDLVRIKKSHNGNYAGRKAIILRVDSPGRNWLLLEVQAEGGRGRAQTIVWFGQVEKIEKPMEHHS